MSNWIDFPVTLRKKLNQLGTERPNPDEEPTLWKNWQYAVWALLYEYLAVNKSADFLCEAIDAFIKGIRSFDPKKGDLSDYAKRSVNCNYKQIKQDTKKKWNDKIVSLEVEKGGEYGETHTREIPVNEDTEGALIVQELMFEIAKYIVLLHQNSVRKNSTQPILFPLWYTEKATVFAQKTDIPCQDEKYSFQAMNLTYLDFFLVETCRTFSALRNSHLKTYNKIDPKANSNEQLEWNNANWLPATVPIGYLQPDSYIDSDISKSRKAFWKAICDLLGWELNSILEKKSP